MANHFKKRHTGKNTSLNNVGKPNQTLQLASSQLAIATLWDGSHFDPLGAGTWGKFIWTVFEKALIDLP